MIELYTLTGENIELVKSDITIELNNSLFNDGEKFQGSVGYEIEPAFTPGNLLRLGFADQLDVKVREVDIPVYAKAGTKTFRKCLLNLAVGEDSFSGSYLKIDLGVINDKISSTKLTEIPFETYLVGTTKAEIESGMMAAATNTDWRTIPYCFFPVRNPDFCGEATAAPGQTIPGAVSYSLINSMHVNGGSVIFDVEPPSEVGWDGNPLLVRKYQVVPFFYLPYVLHSIANWLGYQLKGDFAIHPDVAKAVVYNVNSTWISRYMNDEMLAEERRGLLFAAYDHLPAVAVSEFFKSLCSFFGCRIKLNVKMGTLDISWKKSIFSKGQFKDWSDKLIKVKEQTFTPTDGYKLSAQSDTTSGESESQQPADMVQVGNGKQKVEAKAGTLRSTEEAIPGLTDTWVIPFDKRSGNIIDPAFEDLANCRSRGNRSDFPVRFLYNNGLVSANSFISYPKGSSIGNEINLWISGDKGLFNFSHKPWFDRTYATKVIKASLKLNENDISALDDDDVIRIPSKNGTLVNCLIRKLTFTSSSRKDFVAAEAEMIVLDSAVIKTVTNDKGVYVRVESSNEVRENSAEATYIDYADISVKVYADRFCTIPLVPEQLPVYLKYSYKSVYIHNPGANNEYTETIERTRNHRLLMSTSSVEYPHYLTGGFYKVLATDGHTYTQSLLIKIELDAAPGYVIV